MKKQISVILSLVLLFSCRDANKPDVSGIEIRLQAGRFEQDFFALDTNNMRASLRQLESKYPVFYNDFVQKILGLPPVSDSSAELQNLLKKFISDYKPIKDSSDIIFKDFSDQVEEITEGLRFVKHYFPSYKAPEKLITFIGPMDAYFEASTGGYGDALTTNAFAVGLQLHLGSNFSIYTSEMGQSLYPTYISRKFAPEYIPVNCIKNVVDDMFPENTVGKSLIEKMVEKGKRMYLTDKLMPDTHDTLKIGYTDKQLKGCYENEGLIWNFILTNSLAYNTDPTIIKGYIGESPNTPELGEGSPGYIGLFIGWQIVKKYMDLNPELSLSEMMKLDPRKLFEGSKYRPA
jgi:hypothetical protein